VCSSSGQALLFAAVAADDLPCGHATQYQKRR
jgi:hypothetical protein